MPLLCVWHLVTEEKAEAWLKGVTFPVSLLGPAELPPHQAQPGDLAGPAEQSGSEKKAQLGGVWAVGMDGTLGACACPAPLSLRWGKC